MDYVMVLKFGPLKGVKLTMPYINNESREALQPIENIIPQNVGDLNYCFTQLINNYLLQFSKPKAYVRFNEVIGALECCKLEIYRRLIGPYEDTKVEENGDVYPTKLKS